MPIQIIFRRRTLLVVCLIAFLPVVSYAQTSGSDPSTPLVNTTSTLAHFDIKPSDLPAPNPAEDATNPPRVIPQPADAKLNVPPGFSINTFAEGGFTQPRWMALAPNGDVFVSDSRSGKIIVLRDTNKDGVAEERFTFVEGMKQPFGVAFWRNFVYIGNTDAVVRFTYKSGQTKAQGAFEKIADLPGRGYREHWTRNILFSRDGKKMYVTVGSETNVSVEPEPRARRLSSSIRTGLVSESTRVERVIRLVLIGYLAHALCGRPCRSAID